MSPFSRSVIIDNDVISRLYSVGALSRVLALWAIGTFYVVQHVIAEGKKWPGEGQRLSSILDELIGKGILVVINIDDTSEEELGIYAQMVLLGKFGKGESESIAIACHRGYDIASDDNAAKDECKKISSTVSTYTTRKLLEMAFSDGLLTRDEVDDLKNRV